MKHIYFILFFILINNISFSQEIIRMTKEGGVYTIPCEVNGLRLKFIFDTGASDVSISLSEAMFMLKNGYLSEYDIKGSSYYQIANGDIVEGTTINLRQLKIGSRVLYNVEASIVHSLSSPLLLGQSAISKLGKFSFDYSNNTLILGSYNYRTNDNQHSRPQTNIDPNRRLYRTTLKAVGILRKEGSAMSSIIKYIPSGTRVSLINVGPTHTGDYWLAYCGECKELFGYIHEKYLNITHDMSQLKTSSNQ